jgi:2OG-Fe(II) oxygenase superfamily
MNHAVIDDFLGARDHLDLWDAFDRSVLHPAEALAWNRSYRVSGAGLHDEAADAAPAPLRLLSEKLLTLMRAPPIALDPWTGFTQSRWTYRAGAGLEWHSDTGWLGGYIYFAHPQWRESWGGELLVMTDDAHSDGVVITPRPNRLVLLRGGIRHCVKKVETTRAFRASVSGFFFNSGAAP